MILCDELYEINSCIKYAACIAQKTKYALAVKKSIKCVPKGLEF